MSLHEVDESQISEDIMIFFGKCDNKVEQQNLDEKTDIDSDGEETLELIEQLRLEVKKARDASANAVWFLEETKRIYEETVKNALNVEEMMRKVVKSDVSRDFYDKYSTTEYIMSINLPTPSRIHYYTGKGIEGHEWDGNMKDVQTKSWDRSQRGGILPENGLCHVMYYPSGKINCLSWIPWYVGFGIPTRICYYENGNVKSRNWHFGTEDGINKLHRTGGPAMIEYDENGVVKREVFYENGKLIREIMY